MKPQMDCLSGQRIVKLPGLIDVHVHMREPGGEHKETWTTGSQAALAGGVTMVLAMPNTQPPVVDQKSLTLAENVRKLLGDAVRNGWENEKL